MGKTTYTATFEKAWATERTKTVTDIAATGHKWGEPVITFTEDGKTATAVVTCENDKTHTKNLDAKVISQVKTKPTCETKGTTTYTATVKFNNKVYTATKDVEDIAATGHKWGEPVITFAEDGKTATAVVTCENDKTHTKNLDAKVISQVKTEPTCETKGTTTYTATVEFNSKIYTATKDVKDIAATGHKWDKTSYEWSADGKTCTAKRVCKTDDTHVEEATAKITSKVTTPATCTDKGKTTYTATFENAWATEQTKTIADIAATGHIYKFIVAVDQGHEYYRVKLLVIIKN